MPFCLFFCLLSTMVLCAVRLLLVDCSCCHPIAVLPQWQSSPQRRLIVTPVACWPQWLIVGHSAIRRLCSICLCRRCCFCCNYCLLLLLLLSTMVLSLRPSTVKLMILWTCIFLELCTCTLRVHDRGDL
jgi:hypothetical protein